MRGTKRERNDARQATADDRQIVLDRDLYRKTRRAEALKRVGILFAVLLSAGALLVGAFSLVAIKNGSQADIATASEQRERIIDQNDQILVLQRQVKSLTERVRSCTDHRGACYKAGQKRTADVVGTLNDTAVIASACAVGYADAAEADRVSLTRACLLRALGQEKP